MNYSYIMSINLPLKVGDIPKNVQIPIDINKELKTVKTALNAKPHFDFTISILPIKKEK